MCDLTEVTYRNKTGKSPVNNEFTERFSADFRMPFQRNNGGNNLSIREQKVKRFGIILIIGCGVLTIWGISVVYQNMKTLSWQKVSGEITYVDVEKKVVASSSKYARDSEEYVAILRYCYDFDGLVLSNDKIRPFSDPTFGSKEAADEFTSDYRVGSAVDVYLSPDDPSNSILIPGASATSYIPLSLGTLGVLSGLLLLFKPEMGVIIMSSQSMANPPMTIHSKPFPVEVREQFESGRAQENSIAFVAPNYFDFLFRRAFHFLFGHRLDVWRGHDCQRMVGVSS